MSELKPCPFCGGEAEADTMQGFRAMASGRLENAAAIYCRDCSAQMSFCYSDEPDIPREDVMANLVVAWNTRADLSDALLREAVEALEFYGNPDAWKYPPVKVLDGLFTVEYENAASKVKMDRGKQARATLAKLRAHLGEKE